MRRREQNKGFDKDRKEEETSRWSKEEKRKGSSRRRPTEPPPSELKERGGCTRVFARKEIRERKRRFSEILIREAAALGFSLGRR